MILEEAVQGLFLPLVQHVREGEGDLVPVPECAEADIVAHNTGVLNAEPEGLPDVINRRDEQPDPAQIIGRGHLRRKRALQVVRRDQSRKDVLGLIYVRKVRVVRDRFAGYAVDCVRHEIIRDRDGRDGIALMVLDPLAKILERSEEHARLVQLPHPDLLVEADHPAKHVPLGDVPGLRVQRDPENAEGADILPSKYGESVQRRRG